jgi:hypothetical protein
MHNVQKPVIAQVLLNGGNNIELQHSEVAAKFIHSSISRSLTSGVRDEDECVGNNLSSSMLCNILECGARTKQTNNNALTNA